MYIYISASSQGRIVVLVGRVEEVAVTRGGSGEEGGNRRPFYT